MKYSFKFKLKKIDLFNSSLNFNRISKTFYFDLFFTFASFILIIYMIFTKKFFSLSFFKKVLLVFCVFLFPVIQPLITYLKVFLKSNSFFDNEINISFDEEKIYLSTDKEKTEVLYKDVYNFIKFKNMCVVMYDSIHGQIIPDRVLSENKNDFYDFVSNKIKSAREKANELERKDN